MKIHMQSAINPKRVLCGLKRIEDIEVASNPHGRETTCKRCLNIIEKDEIMDETEAFNYACKTVLTEGWYNEG